MFADFFIENILRVKKIKEERKMWEQYGERNEGGERER